jgi:hypothetical protein
MNGIQIEHILNLIEDKTAANRNIIRREVAEYLKLNMREVANAIALSGQVVIPTTYGGIKLTTEDLHLAVA